MQQQNLLNMVDDKGPLCTFQDWFYTSRASSSVFTILLQISAHLYGLQVTMSSIFLLAWCIIFLPQKKYVLDIDTFQLQLVGISQLFNIQGKLSITPQILGMFEFYTSKVSKFEIYPLKFEGVQILHFDILEFGFYSITFGGVQILHPKF